MANTRKTGPQTADVEIGQRIRFRRMQLGISQEALAAACFVTFQQVQKYEKGTNRVSGSRMIQIAAALQIPPAYFFGDGPGAAPAGDLATLSAVDLSIAREVARLSDRQKAAVRRIIATLAEANEPAIPARAA